jgi:hypothetical protein
VCSFRPEGTALLWLVESALHNSELGIASEQKKIFELEAVRNIISLANLSLHVSITQKREENPSTLIKA